MTEPQAGSDIGALRTSARPNPDGSWSISGTKIFITYGEHDLTENIVHLVLARVPGSPPSTRGISCFIVPKVLPGGQRNGVECIGIERKMGIHASPTCTMRFDRAHGELIGTQPNSGMAQMFTMMNAARLTVGISGLGVTERAQQAAGSYAAGRIQGRAVGAPPETASPIIDHPDVRRMLLHVRSHVEAMRALSYTNACALDLADHGSTAEERSGGRERAQLLTPVTKAWCTDLGSELTRLCTQVHGGAGYISDTGVEQFERDIRIAALYEGTNGIQGIDLVRRKLPMREGAVVRELLDGIDATAPQFEATMREQVRDANAALRQSTEWLLAQEEPQDALAAATPYLRQFGIVLGGFHLARQATVASSDGALAGSARYFCEQVLPQASALVPAVTAGCDALQAAAINL
jgi:acyl-CoA dehydrogenase